MSEYLSPLIATALFFLPMLLGFIPNFIQLEDFHYAKRFTILTAIISEGIALAWAIRTTRGLVMVFIVLSIATIGVSLFTWWQFRYINNKERLKNTGKDFILPDRDQTPYVLLKTPDLSITPFIDSSHNAAGSTYFARVKVKNNHNKSISLNPKIKLPSKVKAYPLVLADQPFTSFNLNPQEEEVVAVAQYYKSENKISIKLPDELNDHRYIASGIRHKIELIFGSPNLQPYSEWFVLFVDENGLQLQEISEEQANKREEALPNLVHIQDDISRPELLELDVNVFRRAKGKVDGFFPIQVCFENRLDSSREIGAISKVHAEISYLEYPTPLELIHVKNGCWVDEHLPHVDFPLGKRHYLLLGFFEINKQEPEVRYQGINVYEFSQELHRPIRISGLEVPKEINGLLRPRRIIARVKLIPQDRQDLVRSYEFGFEVYGYCGFSLPTEQL